LKEPLNGLRKDRKLTLKDVEDGTGIPSQTLHRLEYDSPDINARETRVGYQDIVALAKFYDVSTDYLCGLTENLTHRTVAIDKLHLSDEAIAELMSGKLNTRLLSEIIVHPDFAELLAALEVYIDRTVSENMDILNKVTKVSIDRIKKKNAPADKDEILATLTESIIDGDDYIRYRLTRRFDMLAQSIYEAHRRETQTDADGYGILKTFTTKLGRYEETKEKIPRKTLNTIRQQCVELIQVQTCYVNALTTKSIRFDYEDISDVSKNAMIKLMDELDIKLDKILDNFDGTEKIKWFSDEWNIHQHISAMIGHEQMHIGQIVAFCYATEIHIPDSITNTMALSG
jgi:transcriptional regulator with XRE-family HTH domain